MTDDMTKDNINQQTLQRGLKNRHIQLIAIGRSHWDRLISRLGQIDSFCRTFDFICLYDHRDHLLFNYDDRWVNCCYQT
ncbi:hypothetical protein [Bacillus subtilis]|uniref:hypothetical protein n=1 Tax=Bacillus subtilis TaxID=1423 RepID=UPI003D2575F2